MNQRAGLVPAAFIAGLMAFPATVAAGEQALFCFGLDCPSATDSRPTAQQIWRTAVHIHQFKLQFVEALRAFTHAQIGTFGHEGDDLRSSLEAMRRSLDRWDLAIEELEGIADVDRTTEIRVAIATVYLDRHRARDALRELAAAARRDPRRADIYTLLALAHGLTGNPGEAAAALQRAIALDPGNVVAWYSLAQHLMALGRRDDVAVALRGFSEAVRTATPDRSVAAGAPFERAELLRETAGVAPIFPLGLYAPGYLALKRGDYRAALSLFSQALEADPLRSRGRTPLLKAASALETGAVGEALRLLEGVRMEVRDDPEIHRLLGLALFADGQLENGLGHLRTAVRLAPRDERSRIRLADLLIASNKLTEAEQELLAAIDVLPGSPSLRYRLARVYEAQSRWSDAVDAFLTVEEQGVVVGLDHLYETLGNIYVKRADLESAVAAYAKRIAANPNNAEAHRQLADIYFLRGSADEALAEYAAAIFLDPVNARAYAGMGQVHARERSYAAAVQALRYAVALGDGSSEVRYVLGTMLIRLGRVDEGKAELDAAQRIQAEVAARGQRDFQVEALRRMASSALDAGRHDEAIAALRDAIARAPRGVFLYRDLGEVLLEAGRTQEAIDAFTRVQALEPSAEVAGALAVAYASMRRLDESRQQLEIAKRLREDASARRLRALAGGAP